MVCPQGSATSCIPAAWHCGQNVDKLKLQRSVQATSAQSVQITLQNDGCCDRIISCVCSQNLLRLQT